MPMKKPKVEKLFSGWPDTKINKNGVRISAQYFTPGRKQFAETVKGLFCVTGMVLGAYLGKKNGTDNEFFIGLTTGTFVGYFIGFLLGNFLKKRTEIEFTPEVIRVPSGLGFKNYDRKVRHGFNLELHEEAQREAEREADAQIRRKKYYRDAYHVFMDYLGERVYLADVYKRKKAEALLIRLQGVDQVMQAGEQAMTSHSGEGRGEGSKEPTSSFGERPPLDDQ